MSDELEVTPVSEWSVETVRIRLPSGKVVDLRKKFPAYMLMRTGKLSGELLGAFHAATEGELDDPKLAVDLTDAIVEAMFINPKVGKGGLSPDLLDDADVEYVMERAFGGAPEPSFRDDTDGVGDSGSSEVVGDDPVEPVGDGAGNAGKPEGRQGARKPAARRKSAQS